MKIYLIIFSFLGLLACNPTPEITSDLLDGDVIFDASLYQPENFLVSAKYPNPTPEQLSKPVIIAVHGYSATTFEWSEFKSWTGSDSAYLISQVLLGGHGRTYESFKQATWKDWRTGIIDEYEKLENLGYRNISLVGSSTGGPLILELISSGYFNSHIEPKNIFMIDPIVVSSNKLQSIAGILGPMLGYIETENVGAEKKYWYTFRPHETISELNNLMQDMRKKLQSGLTLPPGTYCKIYHSQYDPVASSSSSVLIYKGLKKPNSTNIDVEIMDSDIHVFTRLELRGQVSQKDRDNQIKAFTEIAQRLE